MTERGTLRGHRSMAACEGHKRFRTPYNWPMKIYEGQYGFARSHGHSVGQPPRTPEQMNRTHLLIVALAVSIALLVPTGAWPYDPTGVDRPDEMEDIELAPATDANGEYAVINGDGEIEILIGDMNPYVDTEGVSQGSVSTIPRIFTARNTGSATVAVWITDDVDALQYVRGEREYESVEGRPNRVTLGPNETVGIGLTIDARDEVAVERADSFSVHVAGVETDRPGSGPSETGDRGRTGETSSEPSSGISTATPSGDVATTSTAVSEETVAPPPESDETDTGTGSLSDATEAPPTSADSDGRSRTSRDDGTNTPTVTPTPTEESARIPTQTVSAPPPESRQSPAQEENRQVAGGITTGRSVVTGLFLVLLALLAVLLTLRRRVRRES